MINSCIPNEKHALGLSMFSAKISSDKLLFGAHKARYAYAIKDYFFSALIDLNSPFFAFGNPKMWRFTTWVALTFWSTLQIERRHSRTYLGCKGKTTCHQHLGWLEMMQNHPKCLMFDNLWLVGGFNPSKKCLSNWIIVPRFGVKIKS